MRRNSILFAALIVVTGASTVSADWSQKWNRFWHNVGVGHHRNNAWPDPFNEADAYEVVAPFEIMKRNGWRLHNTIGHELFREGDGALKANGHDVVRWIATQAPESRREIYVLRGRSEAETHARVGSIQQALARIHHIGPTPTVFVTNKAPSTSSGAWAVQINRVALEEMPPPKLPTTSAAGTAASTQQ